MEIYEVKIYGTGLDKNNRTVNIDKKFTVDVDEYKNAKIANDFRGQALDEYLKRVVPYHYPNVIPQNVSVTVSKKKIPDADAFEKIIAGAATGYALVKSTPKEKAVRKSQKIVSKLPKEIPYSFSQKLEIFNGLNFEVCSEETTKTNLKYIYDNISEYNWESTENDIDGIITENNRSLNLCIGKYEQGLNHLKTISKNPNEVEYYTKLYNSLIKKKESNKPWSTTKKIIVLVLIIIIGFFILTLL